MRIALESLAVADSSVVSQLIESFARNQHVSIFGFAFRFTTRVGRELTCSGKLTPDKSVIRLLYSRPVFSAAKLASFLL
jgi:hypothetical protein